MSEKRTLTPEEISAIVDGLDPIDWVQMELLAKNAAGQAVACEFTKIGNTSR